MSDAPYLPTSVGFDALAELGHVDWLTLHHAYGQGVIGDELYGDVARSLAVLREDPVTALRDGLRSNICHQGTVYEATAYALPFIAAVAAGNVPAEVRAGLTYLLGDIAVYGSYATSRASRADSYGDGVDALLRQTLARCNDYLASIEQADHQLGPLMESIRMLTADQSAKNRQAVLDIVDPED